jgi:hypothetical protein
MMRIFVFFGGIFSGHEKIENSPIINPQQLLLLLHTKNNFVFVSSSSNVFLVHLCCRSALGERNGRPLLDGGTAMLFQDGPAGHEDALAVHQTEGRQSRILLVRVQRAAVRVRRRRRALAVAVVGPSKPMWMGGGCEC